MTLHLSAQEVEAIVSAKVQADGFKIKAPAKVEYEGMGGDVDFSGFSFEIEPEGGKL